MRIQIKHTVLLFAAILAFPVLWAQTMPAGKIAGTVCDAEGEPVYQALIRDEAGREVGTTDLQGRFEIKSGPASILVSMPGYGEQRVAAADGVRVTLREDHTRGDDLLGYGYDIVRRRGTLSESVSTVDGRALEDIPVADFRQMLAGQLSGLGTLETASDPGNPTIKSFVRGNSTLNGTEPLVVIDGIVMQDYNIDYLTAAEVENVVLLKDAAATAIYGLKGANGVLVINTKRGLPGAFDVRVTADFSLQQLNCKPEHFSALDYATLRNEGWRNDGGRGDAPFSADALARIASGSDPLYPNNDYLDMFMRNFSTMERVGVSLSSGTERVRVWSNINVMNQTALFKQESDKYVATPRRFWVNLRAKVDVDISKHVRAFAGIAGNIRNDRTAGNTNNDDPNRLLGIDNNGIYESIFSLPPTMIGPTVEGRVTTVETVPTPTYGILNRSGFTKYTGMYVSTYAGIGVDLDFITRGLSVTGKLAFQSSNDRYTASTQNFSRFYFDYSQGGFRQLGSDFDTSLANNAQGYFQYALNYILQLDYRRTFGKHAVEGHLYSYFSDEQFKDVEKDFPAMGFPYYSHNTGLNLSYVYDDRYVVGATLGLTASDVFARRNRYNFSPAVSAAWVASNEAFLEDAAWLSLLKVRASYGELALDDFSIGKYRYPYADYITKSGTVRLLGNPDLKPEIHRTQNYGIDLGFWDKLSVSFDYFRRHTDNMLIELGNSIPSFQGISVDNYMKVNAGEMKNRGFEIVADYATPLGRGWSIRAGAGWSHARNEVIFTNEMPYPGATGSASGYAYTYREQGFPAGQQFGYLVDRSAGTYISTDEELEHYKAMYEQIGVPRKGDFKYRDLNGDGHIDEKDKAPIGKGSIPTDFLNFRLGFGWKGLEVDLQMQGVAGWWGSVDYMTDRTANGIFNDLHRHAWTEERHLTGARIDAPALSYNTSSTSKLDNDFLIAKRSFWRLKNASISYTLPSRLMRNAGIKRLKIVLSGQNLFTVSALDSKVIDPETGKMTQLPPMRVFNLGVKLDF